MTFRVTYATMSADDADLHAGYDHGIEAARARLGEQPSADDRRRGAPGDGEHEERSPIDGDVVLGRFAQATADDVADAVGAARAFAPTWAATPWQERVGCCATPPTSSATSASSWRR